MTRRGLPHSSHWGGFSVLTGEGGTEVVPHPRDPDPSALLGNIPASVSHPARIARPMVRRGWLESGPGPHDRRGVTSSYRSRGPEHSTLLRRNCGVSTQVTAHARSSAAPMAGPAPDAFTTRRARSIGF